MRGGYLVKGVNKTVIEINNTGNDIFEKIILYVKPQYSMLNTRKLNKEAKVILKNYSFDDYGIEFNEDFHKSRKNFYIISGIAAFAIILTVIALIF